MSLLGLMPSSSFGLRMPRMDDPNTPETPPLGMRSRAIPPDAQDAPQLPSAPPAPAAPARPRFFDDPDSASSLIATGAVLLNGGTIGQGLGQLSTGMSSWSKTRKADDQQAFENKIKVGQLQAAMLKSQRGEGLDAAGLMKARQSLISQIALQKLDPTQKQAMWADAVANPTKYGLDPEVVRGLPAEYTPRMDAMGMQLGMSAYQLNNAARQETHESNTQDWREYQQSIGERKFAHQVQRDAWNTDIEASRYGVTGPDGQPLTSSDVYQAPPAVGYGPRGERNANEGNIKDGKWARSQPGYVGADKDGFARFQPGAGNVAQEKLLGGYLSRGYDTPSAIVNRYAPPGENTPEQIRNYTNYISGQLGIKPGEKVPPHMVPKLAQAMREFENGRTKPLPSAPPSGRNGSRQVVVTRPSGNFTPPAQKVVGGQIYVQNPETGKWYRQ